MISKEIKCPNCTATITVKTWRKFVKCPYCDTHLPFKKFRYEKIDWNSSMYAGVNKWMDCPACRSRNMYLGPSGYLWICPDCGYKISKESLKTVVFWFCDECNTFLNVQPGFTTKYKTWRCTECGHISDVTENNII